MEIVDIQFTGNQDGYQKYESKDLSLLNTVTITNPFGSDQDYVEYFIYDVNGNLLTANYFANTYSPVNPDPVTGTYTAIEVDPEGDAKAEGYNRGSVTISYNFFRKLFNSDITKTFWIKEISGDRTELRICRQDLSNIDLQQAFTDYTNLTSLKAYYPDFYLNFGNDNIIIAVNVLYALQDEEGCLLIKLYEPLPDDLGLKDTLWIVDKLSDSANFNVSIEVPVETVVEVNTLRGPNYNVDIIEKVGQTTPLYNYSSVFQTDLSASYQQIKSLMEEKGLDINVDYTDFSNFTHFSSATERIYNFAYKVQQIENYTNDINTLSTVASNEGIVPASKQVLQENINTIIEKFDGYEYYLYYTSASDAWPKSGSAQPYALYSVTSSQAINWLGGPNIEPSTGVHSILYSASVYDNVNPDALTNTVPNYLKNDTANTPYFTFLNMVGQHFDNIWIYLKDVTERYDAENNLDKGISKDLVGDALRALGIKLYTNTSISDNLYYSLLAINPDGSLTPPTGNELINYYIPFAANGLYVVSEYVDPDYVETLLDTGTTVAGDDITKEYYKRLYHNVPYLLKTKGTMRGLRALINCFGIPDTILRINEYGGSDKLEATPDLVQRRHSLAYYNSGSATLNLPWVGQNYYYISGGLTNVVPDTIEFRFKSTGVPDTTHISQSIFQIGSGATTQLGLNLIYTASLAVPSSSYENYGAMRLFLSGTQGYAKTAPITLPFYDTDLWWNIMITRETGSGQAQNNGTSNRYWVYAKSTAYDEEGNATIAFQGSQSIYVNGTLSSSYNKSWNTFNTSSYNSIFAAYLGGTGSNNVLSPNNAFFQGFFQEFRYWATPLSESAFNEHVINSTSYRGNNLTASLFDLTFRLPLGSNLNVPYLSTGSTAVNQKDYDLYELGITGISNSASLSSYHPAITGALTPCNSYQITNTDSDGFSYTYTACPSGIRTTATINDGQTQTVCAVTIPTTIDPLTITLQSTGCSRLTGIPSFISGSTRFSYGLFGGTVNNRYFQPFEITDLIPTPSTGGSQKVNNKVSVATENNLTENLLSPDISIQRYDSSISKNSTDIEVGFAPSDVLDLDISNQLGYFNIDEYIGSPSDAYSSSYQSLDNLRATYFEKYTSKYNVEDFIRLIKYYDNSLFKMIKDFVPARANLSTGIIVKPHILERAKYPRHEPIVTNEANWSGSIDMVSISGSNPEDAPALTSCIRYSYQMNADDGVITYVECGSRYPKSITLDLYNILGPSSATLDVVSDIAPELSPGMDVDLISKETYYPQGYTPNYLNTSYTSSITTPLGVVTTIETDLSQPFTGDFGGNELQVSDNYFSQTEVSSITAPWTSSIKACNLYRVTSINIDDFYWYTTDCTTGITLTDGPLDSGQSQTGYSTTFPVAQNGTLILGVDYTVDTLTDGSKIFTTYSIDPLQNNVSTDNTSTYRLKVDYSSNPNIPVNLGILTASLAKYPVSPGYRSCTSYLITNDFGSSLQFSFVLCPSLTTETITLATGNSFLACAASEPVLDPAQELTLRVLGVGCNRAPIGNAWPSAEVNDYSWVAYSRTNPRYQGSRLVGLDYSVYSTASISWPGDISYGKSAVIDKIKNKYAYLVNIYTASFALPGRSNAQIKYIVDNDSNTLNLAKTNQNIFDVQNIFKSGETIQVSLFDFNPTNPDVQVLTNNKTLQLYEGGYRYSPVIFNIGGTAQLTYALPTPYVSSSQTTVNTQLPILPGQTNYWGGLDPVIYSFPTYYTTNVQLNFNTVVGTTSTVAVTVPIHVNYSNPGDPRDPQSAFNEDYYFSVVIPTSQTAPYSAYITVPQRLDSGYGYIDITIGDNYGSSTEAYYGTTTTTTNTYFTSVTDPSSSWYAVSQRTVKLSATQSLWYGQVVFSGSYPGIDPVVFPLSLTEGDMVKFYSDTALWGSEGGEYRVVYSQRVTDSTGSFIYLTLDRDLDPILTDHNRIPDTISKYIAMKHVPDETNLILRYAPTAPVLQDGLAIPQYIDPVVQANAGNVVQALKANNLI